MRRAIGVDIGGTKIAIALVGEDGTLDGLRAFPTPGDGEQIVALVVRGCREVLAAGAGAAAGTAPVVGVGVGTGGVVDPHLGRIVHASDLLRGWAGIHLAERLSAALSLPVRVDNDGNAFALAESWFGAGRGVDDALYVAVGTGIGGGVVLGGEIRRGPRHLAGEFGHLAYPTDRRCSCGLTGHVEAVASGPSLTAIYRERSGLPVTTLQEVAARQRAGDGLARAVLEDGAGDLGRALSSVVLALDVPLVVVGGGVGAGLGPRYLCGLRDAMAAALPHDMGVRVCAAALGADAAVTGAAVLALRASGATRPAPEVRSAVASAS